jgi:hypothetical protein
VRGKTSGEYRFSSLVKLKKRGGKYELKEIAGFIFKFFSVMKCLGSKKKENSLITTTYVTIYAHMHTRTHAHTHTRTHAHTHTRTQTHTHTNTHAHTHTRTQTLRAA